MKVVGLTGGIGSGKSTVAKMLVSRGAGLIDADLLAREVVEPDKPAWQDIVTEFGESLLNPDRTIDREALARVVFEHDDKRGRLNEITHPRIGERMMELVRSFEEQGIEVVIIDAALLFESSATRWIRPVIVVAADEKKRIERVCQRDGAVREEVEKRMQSQWTDEEKKKHADYLIDNSGDLASLEEQVECVWQRIKKDA